ncbi:gag-like protein [Lasius niger]|uniref:Gag-like protein n=1 Tax=Lasius niger TaxID=67767 RepID=A0A0J7JYJ0_LASNI|nr:gag-like protein [Lasius niger]
MEVDSTDERDSTSKRARDVDDDASQRSASPGSSSGRGRPPTTGEYVGLAAAKANVYKMEQEELMLKAERELLDTWTSEPKVTRARRALLGGEVTTDEGSVENPDPSSLSATDLAGQLQKSVQALYRIASFKKGYKGTSQQILKEAAGVVSAVGAELLGRTQDDESRRLRDESRQLKEANTRLSGEVEELRKQLNELKGKVTNMVGPREPIPPDPSTSWEPMEVTPAPLPQRNKRKSRDKDPDPDHPSPPSPVLDSGGGKRGRSDKAPAIEKESENTSPGLQSIVEAVTGRMMARIEARFSVIEKRLPPEILWPPLAADRKAAALKAKYLNGRGALMGRKGGGFLPCPPHPNIATSRLRGVEGGGRQGYRRGGPQVDPDPPSSRCQA